MRKKYLLLLGSIIVSFLFVTVYTYGATTISTNVNTGGALTASGATTLNGNVTLGDATTDTIWSQGLFNASSTLQATGAVRFYSTSITDGSATFNGDVTVGNAIGDTLTITAGTVAMSDVATTTIPNAKMSAWTIATSTTTSIPTFTVSTVSSPVGRVGIGTSTPSVELDVNGYARVMQSATGTACATNIKGAIFYNDANGLFWGCDGTNWLRLTN